MSDALKNLINARNNNPITTEEAEAHTSAVDNVPEIVPDKGRPALKLGVIDIPDYLETRHILAVGTTGSGKSQAIYQLLNVIGRRSEPAIIIDHSAEFLQRYYRKDIDLIFNPFDERSIGWSPFNEVKRIYDFDRIARAIVPDIPGDNQDWQMGAQQLLSNVMRSLWNLGKTFRTNEALIYFLTKATTHSGIPEGGASREEMRSLLTELADMGEADKIADVTRKIRDFLSSSQTENQASLQYILKDSTSTRLFEFGNEKQLAITLGMLGRYIQPLTYLKEGNFSMTDFVKQFETAGACKSWLFLSYTDASYSAIRSLFSIMVTCAVQSALELSESATRRFYLVFDEFASLDKIDAVDDALTKMRKRGGVLIAGIQSTAQLEEKYGKVGAQVLLSCFSNLLMLRVADDETAAKLERLCGVIEIMEESRTSGTSENSGKGGGSEGWSNSTTTQKKTQPRILGSEFYGLDDLKGYVRIVGHKSGEIFETKVPFSKLPLIAPAEITMTDVMLDLT